MRLLGIVLVYAAFALAYSYPVSAHLGSHVYDPQGARGLEADTYLVLWILTWGAHALTTQPARLFDANHLYPAHDTLATAENLLGFLPFSAPVYWATGNAVLAAHVAMLASYVASAVGVFLLVRRWTGPLPAFLAGLAYGYAPWRIPSVGFLNFMGVQWWPFLLLALERAVTTGSAPALIGVTGALVAATLSSLYFGYVAFFLVPLHALVHARTLRRHPRRALRIAAASAAAVVLLAPLMRPYMRLRAEGIVSPHSPLAQFLSLGSLLAWLPSYLPPLALGTLGIAIVTGVRRPLPRAAGMQAAWRLVLYLVVTGTVLALGTYLHWGGAPPWIPLPYLLLTYVVPGFSSARVPLRFFALASLGFAIALGLALEGLSRRTSGRTGRLAVAALACLLAAELFWRRPPIGLKAIPVASTMPPVYRYLREHGAGRPLLEVTAQKAAYQEARAMYFSSFHWLPLLNGHTGHFPPTYQFLMRRAERLPAADAVRELSNLVDLGWIILYRDTFGPAALSRWEPPPPGLERVGDFDTAVLYRVAVRPNPDLRARLQSWAGATETLTGAPLVPLPLGSRSGRLTASVPTPMRAVAGQRINVAVTVQNRSSLPWPGYAVTTRHLVVVRARWIDSAGRPGDRWRGEFRLPADLPPGGTTVVPIEAPIARLAAANLELEVTLAQDEDDFPPALTPPLRLPVHLGEHGSSNPPEA